MSKLKNVFFALALLIGAALASNAQVFYTLKVCADAAFTQCHIVPVVASDTFSLLAAAQTLTTKTISLASNTLTGTTAQFNTALSDNDFATLAGSETLTTKTINLTSNTLTGTTAQFNTALSDNDFATLAGAETLTNKTISVEGAGNVITTLDRLSFRAALCQNATAISDWSTPVTDPAVFACNTGTNTQKGTADFADGAAVLSMQRSFLLPADFTGAVDVRLKWFTSAIAGDVVWQVASICVADAETSDPAFNAASTVTDTAKGTTLQDNDAAIAGLTTTGCAAGETIYLRVFRDPAHASDTLAATASLRAVEFTVRRAQ